MSMKDTKAQLEKVKIVTVIQHACSSSSLHWAAIGFYFQAHYILRLLCVSTSMTW